MPDSDTNYNESYSTVAQLKYARTRIIVAKTKPRIKNVLFSSLFVIVESRFPIVLKLLRHPACTHTDHRMS